MYHVGDNNDGVDEHVDPEVQPGAALTTAHVVVLISENRCQVNWNIITHALNMDRGGEPPDVDICCCCWRTYR
jgi:hypothetical protein